MNLSLPVCTMLVEISCFEPPGHVLEITHSNKRVQMFLVLSR